MNNIIITVDLDWACEAAIEETLDFLRNKNIPITVFITHRSSNVEECMNEIEVGLHPYFNPNSSHGATITETVKYVMDLPHNLPAFRCHQFASCNASRQAMFDAGIRISSNVCTDLEIISPFKDRHGFLEVPIFLEDGGYLWRQHPLTITSDFIEKIFRSEFKVINIHPMHFVLNTPNFKYMRDIKDSVSRQEWKNMTKRNLEKVRWKGRGIRDFIIELLEISPQASFLSTLLTPH